MFYRSCNEQNNRLLNPTQNPYPYNYYNNIIRCMQLMSGNKGQENLPRIGNIYE